MRLLRDPVCFPWIDDEFGWNAFVLQRAVKEIALLDGNVLIDLAV